MSIDLEARPVVIVERVNDIDERGWKFHGLKDEFKEGHSSAVVRFLGIKACNGSATVGVAIAGYFDHGERVAFEAFAGYECDVDSAEDLFDNSVEGHLDNFVDDSECGISKGDGAVRRAKIPYSFPLEED